MIDVIIIGGGPAGVTAALYTARANFKTTIICKDQGALGKAERVDNYYGHMEISGQTLMNTGLEQARHVGAEIVSDEAVSMCLTDAGSIIVATISESYEARAAILATGATRFIPKIKGFADVDGRGISYCAICDGFFHRGKDVAVLGSGAYALHEVEDLLPVAHSVTLLTNGEEPSVDFPEKVIVRSEKIKEITANKSFAGKVLKGIILENGTALDFSGLFIAVGIAGGTELARKMGAIVEKNAVVVDSMMLTSVPGLWAAGDCTGGLKQIAKATYQGAEAGMDIIRYLRERDRL